MFFKTIPMSQDKSILFKNNTERLASLHKILTYHNSLNVTQKVKYIKETYDLKDIQDIHNFSTSIAKIFPENKDLEYNKLAEKIMRQFFINIINAYFLELSKSDGFFGTVELIDETTGNQVSKWMEQANFFEEILDDKRRFDKLFEHSLKYIESGIGNRNFKEILAYFFGQLLRSSPNRDKFPDIDPWSMPDIQTLEKEN